MSFRLNLDNSPKREIARVGQEEFDELIKQINNGPEQLDIHSARKSIKRLRALVSLTTSNTKSERSTKVDRQLRAVARRMSGERDHVVRAETLTALQKRYGLGGLATNAVQLEKGVRQKRRKKDSAALATEIAEIKRRFLKLPSKAMRVPKFIAATSRDYHDGKQTLRHLDFGADANDFHELRKHVQRQWRHMLLLEDIWPKEMATRAKLAKKLSELLGTDHDLAMLHDWLSQQHPSIIAEQERNGLSALTSAWQLDLRREALPLARRLYAESSRSFRKRLERYFKATMKLPRKNNSLQENVRVTSQHIVHLQRRV
jgi:CHAD domain-containing protein